MNICIYGASSDNIDAAFKEKGFEMGEIIAQSGSTLVFGAGNGGMMGAIARGVTKGGGNIIGISPAFFNVDGVLYENSTEMIYTDTMSERKTLLEEKADAFLVTPGGIGTFDEFFETITLRQLSVHKKPIAIYNINDYFKPLIDLLETAIDKNFMSAENRKLYFISESPAEIMKYFSEYNPETIPDIDFRNTK